MMIKMMMKMILRSLEIQFIKLMGKCILFFDLHHDIFFFLLLIFFFVSRMLVHALCPRCTVWAARVLPILTLAAGAALSSCTAECSGNPERDQEVPIRDNQNQPGTLLEAQQEGQQAETSTNPAIQPADRAEPSSGPLGPEQPSPPSSELTAEDLIAEKEMHLEEEIKPILISLAQQFHNYELGERQAGYLFSDLLDRHGLQKMPEIIQSLDELRDQSPYIPEIELDFINLLQKGGTEEELKKDEDRPSPF
jgi:hypothetical protein